MLGGRDPLDRCDWPRDPCRGKGVGSGSVPRPKREGGRRLRAGGPVRLTLPQDREGVKLKSVF